MGETAGCCWPALTEFVRREKNHPIICSGIDCGRRDAAGMGGVNVGVAGVGVLVGVAVAG